MPDRLEARLWPRTARRHMPCSPLVRLCPGAALPHMPYILEARLWPRTARWHMPCSTFVRLCPGTARRDTNGTRSDHYKKNLDNGTVLRYKWGWLLAQLKNHTHHCNRERPRTFRPRTCRRCMLTPVWAAGSVERGSAGVLEARALGRQVRMDIHFL